MIDKFVIFKLMKYSLVGSSGMILDFGITWLLKEKFKINKYVANSTGFVLAASSNYFLNRFWTFKSHNNQIATEYLSFFGISIIGLLINNLIIYLLSDRIKLNFYSSKLIAIIIVTLWNFGMNYLFTFSV